MRANGYETVKMFTIEGRFDGSRTRSKTVDDTPGMWRACPMVRAGRCGGVDDPRCLGIYQGPWLLALHECDMFAPPPFWVTPRDLLMVAKCVELGYVPLGPIWQCPNVSSPHWPASPAESEDEYPPDDDNPFFD